MNSKKKKNFRTIFLKQSLSPDIFSPKKNLFKQSNKITSNTSSKFEYSKTKDNKYDSSKMIIKTKNKILPCKSIKLFDVNNRYENSKATQFPTINNFTTTSNTIDTKVYKSLDVEHHLSKLNRKFSQAKYKLPIKKSLFDSFDYEAIKRNKRANNQRYIRLSKVFKKFSLDEDIFPFNTIKSELKDKESNLKIPNIKEYNNYIINKLKINFNKNFESSFIHKLNSDFMIKSIEKKNNYILNCAKQYENEIKNGEIEGEEKDKIDDKNLGKVKLSKKIKNYLINRHQTNLIGKEAKIFFSKKENIINFIYDINLVPNFRNNLIKYKSNDNKLYHINFIDHNTLRYLNIAKIKIQKNKDQRHTLEYIQEQIGEEKVDLSKIEIDKNYTEKFDLFEIENYLAKKKFNQNKVKIFNDKTKFFFYDTFMKLHDKK